MTCVIDGCKKPVTARGWCGMHYARWKKHGHPLAGGPFRNQPTCSRGHTYRPEDVDKRGQRWCRECARLGYFKRVSANQIEFSTTPCYRCGGKKPPGRGRKFCDDCRKTGPQDAYLKRQFGISVADYKNLFDIQNGRCGICHGAPRTRRLSVDHDHATGAVRGLLCNRCNHRLLGSARDSIAVLQQAINYLVAPPASLITFGTE